MWSLTFTTPALLAGTAFIAVPLLVHLWLRPRPRRVSFPALALLRPALLSGQRARRVRNLWLLLLRCMLIAGAACLLAGPTCRPVGDSAAHTGPVAAVIIVDDSLSTRYPAADGEPLSRRIRARASTYARDAAHRPRGSALALVFADPRQPTVQLTSDLAGILATLRASGSGASHAVPLGAAFDKAAAILREARQENKEIAVFTDGASHSWADVTPALLGGIEDVSVRVFISAASHPTNLELAHADSLDERPGAGMILPMRIEVRTTGVGADVHLAVELDGAEVTRAGPLHIAADGASATELVVPPLAPGRHGLTCTLKPADHLDYDEVRYVAVDVRPRPVVWLVHSSDTPPDDSHQLILRNLLAPETLPSERQLIELRVLSVAETPAALAEARERQARPPLVILTGAATADAAVDSLLDLTRQGACLVLMADERDADVRTPSALWSMLSSEPPSVEDAPAVDRLKWMSDSPWAADEALSELTRAVVRRRVRITDLLPEAIVEARFTDDAPAIVRRPVGRGRLVALLTNATPAWSDMGIRAGGLLVWLHTLIDETAPVSSNVANLVAHEVSRRRFPALSALDRVTVQRVSGAERETTSCGLSDGLPETSWPTDDAGLYAIRTSAGVEVALYAVNWPNAESRLDPVTPDSIREVVGTADLSLDASEPGADTPGLAPAGWWSRWLSPSVLLGLLLVLLLLGEAAATGGGDIGTPRE
ncbi:MAG: BatA and WFA domain-containing protein [Phycisphaerae bacterium]|nr:BatA and WFA domain-containing protein [Phycisphaerae bacterium]